MSIGTLLGFFAGIGLFVGAIFMSTDNYGVFVSLSSFIIVVGGALAASFVSYEIRYVMLALKMTYKIHGAPTIGRNLIKGEVGRIIRWAYVVQKSGIPALESEVKKGKVDSFLAFGADLVISGYSGDDVREILSNTIETTYGRNTVQAKILNNIGACCPAFGMIGTLVGLVIMLGNLNDPTTLGPSLSIALITTLYGVLFQRLIFVPTADKVQQREEILRFRNYLVAEGLVLLADQKGPRYIQDKMNGYLDPAIHFNIDKDIKK